MLALALNDPVVGFRAGRHDLDDQEYMLVAGLRPIDDDVRPTVGEGNVCKRTSKSVSAFQFGPAAAPRARASRLWCLEAPGLTAATPSTISIPMRCSLCQKSYCSVLIWACIHFGATIPAVIVYLIGGA